MKYGVHDKSMGFNMFLLVFFYFFLGIGLLPLQASNEQKQTKRDFVIVTASYNNEKWVQRNLESIFSQDHPNFRVIYWDDCSTDNTVLLVNKFIKDHNVGHKIQVHHNKKRVGPHYNIYRAIHSCKDTEIAVIVDGDDWLAHDKVLSKLNSVYANPDVWLTYGHHIRYPSGEQGISREVPKHIIKDKKVRFYPFVEHHLRTFYAWLYKRIKKQDLMFDGAFVKRWGDVAIMFPMVEMAATHSRFIPDVLLIYNYDNPINYHKPQGSTFASLNYARGVMKKLRSIKPYEPLDVRDARHYALK